MKPIPIGGENENYLKWLKQLRVCDIDKHCVVDVREWKLRGFFPNYLFIYVYGLESTKNSLNDEVEGDGGGKMIGRPAEFKKQQLRQEDALEVAHSVDVSGTGDPCSFRGPHYALNWSYNKASDCVDFVMRHSVKKGKWWSALGIGDTMLVSFDYLFSFFNPI